MLGKIVLLFEGIHSSLLATKLNFEHIMPSMHGQVSFINDIDIDLSLPPSISGYRQETEGN